MIRFLFNTRLSRVKLPDRATACKRQAVRERVCAYVCIRVKSASNEKTMGSCQLDKFLQYPVWCYALSMHACMHVCWFDSYKDRLRVSEMACIIHASVYVSVWGGGCFWSWLNPRPSSNITDNTLPYLCNKRNSFTITTGHILSKCITVATTVAQGQQASGPVGSLSCRSACRVSVKSQFL